jgi:hypothetical protein
MTLARSLVPRSIVAVLLLAAGVALAGQSSSRAAAAPTLYVTYALNCTFVITDDSGKTVTSIAPGAYQVQVTTPGSFSGVDLSGISDFTACKGFPQFQLTGPGVNVQTTLNGGDASQDVLSATFQPSSTYVAQDNNQPSVAHATFTTLAAGTAPAPTGTTTSAGTTTGTTTTTPGTKTTPSGTVKGTLKGSVSAGGALKLTYKGKSVITLQPGLYAFSVADKSKTNGFIVQELHGATTTVSGIASVGTRSVTINLKVGQWFFFGTKKGAKSGFAVTAGLEG